VGKWIWNVELFNTCVEWLVGYNWYNSVQPTENKGNNFNWTKEQVRWLHQAGRKVIKVAKDTTDSVTAQVRHHRKCP